MKTYATTPSIGDFEHLERFMQDSLTPVSPRPEFVQQLHHRLTDPMMPRVRLTQPVGVQNGLLIFASVISGIIFFITASQVLKALMKKHWGV